MRNDWLRGSQLISTRANHDSQSSEREMKIKTEMKSHLVLFDKDFTCLNKPLILDKHCGHCNVRKGWSKSVNDLSI